MTKNHLPRKSELIKQYHDNIADELKGEIKALDEKYKLDLDAAKDNAEKKNEIEEKHASRSESNKQANRRK
jgi:hypothetical protein